MAELSHIRNFSIIAHIDHGKSTLADRHSALRGFDRARDGGAGSGLNGSGAERGITIKAQSVTLDYTSRDGSVYQLNFIDTPWHVDFSCEVSRSLAACEGALLVVDAGQSVEAQSVANCYTAIEQGLEVLPVLNKMDGRRPIPNGFSKKSRRSLELTPPRRYLPVLNGLVSRTCWSTWSQGCLLQWAIEKRHCRHSLSTPFDNYLGVVSLVRVKQGVLTKRDKFIVHLTGKQHQADMIGVFTPRRTETGCLTAGEVGFVVAGIKDIKGAPVGDTLISAAHQETPALPGFKSVKPQVYAGILRSIRTITRISETRWAS